MSSRECLEFIYRNTSAADISGKSIIEVGSRDVNGSIRTYINSLNPARYLGVDIIAGSSVDELCDVEKLLERYGSEKFDVVISMEVLDHVCD